MLRTVSALLYPSSSKKYLAQPQKAMTTRGTPEKKNNPEIEDFFVPRRPLEVPWVCRLSLTPAQGNVPGEVLLQWEKGAAHQGEQEVALHQQPAVVGQDGVVGEHQHQLASCLSPDEREKNNKTENGFRLFSP